MLIQEKKKVNKVSVKNKLKTEVWNNNNLHNINENNNIMIFSNSNYYENNIQSLSKMMTPSKFNKINKEEKGIITNNEYKNVKKIPNFSNIQIDLINNADINNIDMQEYLSTEIEDMDYEDVIKKDKREFCQYFNEKLKINQIILNYYKF